jgi:hypothetical protein
MSYQQLDEDYMDYSSEPVQWLQRTTRFDPDLYSSKCKYLSYHVAVHEAAHAVLNELYKYAVTTVQIRSGQTETFTPNGTNHAHSIVILYAAYIASLQVINPREAFSLANDDNLMIDRVRQLAGFTNQQVRKLCAECRVLVEQNWVQIEAVACALADKGKLSGDEVRAIIQSVAR